jgi:hypothetical protein
LQSLVATDADCSSGNSSARSSATKTHACRYEVSRMPPPCLRHFYQERGLRKDVKTGNWHCSDFLGRPYR